MRFFGSFSSSFFIRSTARLEIPSASKHLKSIVKVGMISNSCTYQRRVKSASFQGTSKTVVIVLCVPRKHLLVHYSMYLIECCLRRNPSAAPVWIAASQELKAQHPSRPAVCSTCVLTRHHLGTHVHWGTCTNGDGCIAWSVSHCKPEVRGLEAPVSCKQKIDGVHVSVDDVLRKMFGRRRETGQSTLSKR